MTLIPISLPKDNKTKEKKKMLTIGGKKGKTYVEINFSSLDLINTCKKKAFYVLEEKLISKDESPALSFGSAIHKALEVWYSADPKDRHIPVNALDNAVRIVHNHDPHEVNAKSFLFYKAIIEFAKVAPDITERNKRSKENGAKILTEYFRKYKDDGLIVMTDESGPLVERSFSFRMHESDELIIDYFGTIDVILKNPETDVVMVTDHKTTSTLGNQFYDRLKPNHQYTGYIWGAKELGIDTNLFMVNGLQVALTKHDFARQITERTQEDYNELYIAVLDATLSYLDCKKNDKWPMNAPNPCTMYGGCQFLNLCNVPESIRENVKRAKWDV